MNVTLNGMQKTGTHALVKGVQLLGFPEGWILHTHQSYPYKYDKHICIFRHPRNCLISMCRWNRQPITTGMLIKFLREYDHYKSMTEIAKGFTPWLNSSALIIRYEDLVASDLTLRTIAQYLDVPYLEDAFSNLPGLTLTWTGKPSRWEDYWNEELDRVWINEGMQEVQTAWNY
jgi:hypothetical protein